MSVWIRQQIGPFTLLYEIDTLRYEMTFPKNCSRAFTIVRQAPMLMEFPSGGRLKLRAPCLISRKAKTIRRVRAKRLKNSSAYSVPLCFKGLPRRYCAIKKATTEIKSPLWQFFRTALDCLRDIFLDREPASPACPPAAVRLSCAST